MINSRPGRIVAVILTLSCVVVFGCAAPAPEAPPAAAASGEPRHGGTASVGVLREPSTFVDWIARTSVDQMVANLVFQRLVQPDGAGGYRPDLAASWTVENDGQVVRFTLRDDLSWDDGRPVTAEDVLFSWRRVHESADGAEPDPDLARVSRDGERGVVFSFRGIVADPVGTASANHIYPHHLLGDVTTGDLLKHPFNRAPVGSGAFRLEQWESQRFLSFVPRVSGSADGPFVERLALRIHADRAAALRALEAGELDLIFGLRPVSLPRLRQNDRIRTRQLSIRSYITLIWNVGRPPVDDVGVRRALSAAIDRRELARQFAGSADAVAAGPVPPSHPWYTAVDPPAVATGPLRLPDGSPIRVALDTIGSNPFYRDLAAVVADDWRDAGVEVELRASDGEQYTTRLSDGGFQVIVYPRHGSSPVDLAGCFGADGVDNYGGFVDPELDAILAELARADVRQRATALFEQARRRIRETEPWSFLFYRSEIVAWSPRLHGLGEPWLQPMTAAASWWLDDSAP